MKIVKKISVEDLVDNFPFAVKFLREKNIVCVICGEPVWGTLEELAKSKGYSDDEIDKIVSELNQQISK